MEWHSRLSFSSSCSTREGSETSSSVGWSWFLLPLAEIDGRSVDLLESRAPKRVLSSIRFNIPTIYREIVAAWTSMSSVPWDSGRRSSSTLRLRISSRCFCPLIGPYARYKPHAPPHTECICGGATCHRFVWERYKYNISFIMATINVQNSEYLRQRISAR